MHNRRSKGILLMPRTTVMRFKAKYAYNFSYELRNI